MTSPDDRVAAVQRSGCMISLQPSWDSSSLVAVGPLVGALPVWDIHATLVFMGLEKDLNANLWHAFEADMERLVDWSFNPFTAKISAVTELNKKNDKVPTALVALLHTDQEWVSDFRRDCLQVVRDHFGAMSAPQYYTPWLFHMTVAYLGEDLALNSHLNRHMQKLLETEVSFTSVKVSRGDVSTIYPPSALDTKLETK